MRLRRLVTWLPLTVPSITLLKRKRVTPAGSTVTAPLFGAAALTATTAWVGRACVPLAKVIVLSTSGPAEASR